MDKTQKDRLGLVLYLILATMYVALLLVPLSARIQGNLMQKFHPSRQTFRSWMIWQLYPSMYNFSNEIQFGGSPESLRHFQVNHYPLRLIYFRLGRMALREEQYHIYLHSTYRGKEVASAFLMTKEPQGWKLSPWRKGAL